MRLDPKQFDREVLAQLLKARILVFYKWVDVEVRGEYLGLSPWARRMIYLVPRPHCEDYQAFEDFSKNFEKVESQNELIKTDGLRA